MSKRIVAGIEHNSRSTRISIIIPAYNEEKTIGEVLSRIIMLSAHLGYPEIIVVNDGSKDQTGRKVEGFPFVKYIAHKRNVGKGAAICTGFRAARGDVLVIQDADLEYSPTDIPALVDPIIKDRADVVYGSRFKGAHVGMSLSHYLANRLLSLATRLLYRVSVTDVETGYKCFAKRVVESLDLKEKGFNIEVEMTAQVLKNGWRFAEIPITYKARVFGYSKIRYIDGVSSILVLLRELGTSLPRNRKKA